MIRPLQTLGNYMTAVRHNGFLAATRSYWSRLNERISEWRLGISSDEVIHLEDLGLQNEERREYGPTQYRDFHRLEEFIRPATPNESFIDYGSGLGRILVLAAMLPFRRVIGIEISSELADRARRNVDQLRAKLRCQDVEILTCDATTFEVPTDVTTLYFNNPFAGSLLTSVLNNIRSSHQQKPRRIKLICNLPNESEFGEQIRMVSWLELQQEVSLSHARRGLVFFVKERA
jgi:SAM-dependent methyltransferase